MQTTAYINIWRDLNTGSLEAEGVHATPEEAAQHLLDVGPGWRDLGYVYDRTLTDKGEIQVDDLAQQLVREAEDELFHQRQEARAYREAAL